MNVVEPGHELTATPLDPEGLSTTVCECGSVSPPGTDAQPYLEFVEKVLTRHLKDRELSGLGTYVALR